LLLAALVGVAVVVASSPPRVDLTILGVLAIGLLGYVVAGVIGKVFAEAVVDRLWPAAALIRGAAAPLTFGLRQVERLVEWLAVRPESRQRPATLRVEVAVENDLSQKDIEPELPETARVLLANALALTRTDVGDLMTPRSSIVSLPSTVSAADAAATFRKSGLSRVPIFGESRDDILGILYLKDLFARASEGRTIHAISPRDLVRPALLVPESKNAFELFEELRADRRHVAIALDEYGSVAGLVTLEDLLERLVGRIDDEHDIQPLVEPVRKLGGSRYEVDAMLALDEINLRLGLHLPTETEYQTIGGLVFHELGRAPRTGDSVNVSGATFTVLEVSDHSARRLMIDLEPDTITVESAHSGGSA
jgi:CBS domain containing-hemolysin-like protein